jgi:hypothetical protein
MAKLDQEALSQIVAAVMQVLGNQGVASPKPASQYRNSFGEFDPIAKDKQLLAAFHRRGFKDTVLMDRADKSKPYNIRPYKGWIELGRVVRKGERGVRGLFHIDQTDVIPSKAPASPPKAVIPTWRKAAAKAAKAKAKLQPVS